MEEFVQPMATAFDSRDETQICSKLQEFNKENAQTFSFKDLNTETKKKLIGDILQCLGEAEYGIECKRLCLETVRILSRDKFRLLQLQEEEGVSLLMKFAGLTNEDFIADALVEAQKSLCNLVYNSQSVQQICGNTDCVQNMLMRVNNTGDPALNDDTRYYDLRLLFLITAFNRQSRSVARLDCNGVSVLTNTLHSHVLQPDSTTITSKQLLLAVEVLKCFFNITIDVELNEENEETLELLGCAIQKLFLVRGPTEEEIEKLHGHLTNFLTVFLPKVCIKQLIPESEEGACGGSSIYMGHSMQCVNLLLKFMLKRLDEVEGNSRLSGLEVISPALTALCAVSKTEALIRKYLKEKVLPPLTATICSSLPEEGDSLRNRLVRFMTSPNTNVKELVAEFLFILCKENPGRLVKYTGYGNAAGLLARRGLMTLGKGHGDYSSDEDSDTDTYSDVIDKINPITGRVEENKPSPLEGMSDEQKEHEAQKLAQLCMKLSREGIIKPMSVGADGKMVSLEESFNQMSLPEEHDDSEEDT
ncbi:synembryn-A-like [Anneissia japonica]|uniref:synembryn-A-like n=1 Tax=Anneissia japonica TaxID=1529436 RepID=UPI001425B754|nr:synembryn-A-like [Anneissia japonica]